MHTVALVLVALPAAEPLTPGDRTRTLEFGGRTRSYIVHVPPRHDPQVEGWERPVKRFPKPSQDRTLP